MIDFLSGSTYFALALTFGAFGIGSLIQKKWKLAIFNPILIGSLLVILVLTLLDIPNEEYQAGCEALTMLLTPATICLAISLYEQLQQLKPHLIAVLAGVVLGSVASIGCIWCLSWLMGLDETVLRSLLPKSVTTAIGIALSDEIGGISAITAGAIAITGIGGNICGKAICKLGGIKDEVAQGVAFGTASHVVGTHRAAQLSQLTGAVSSLSLTIAGLLTAVLLSFIFQ